MKKKNAFTLIELLAVIVILAIIALIATPIILGIVEDAKRDAFLRSVEMIVSTTDLDINTKIYESTYMYEITNGDINNLDIPVKNTKGMNGSVKYNKKGKNAFAVNNGKYCVVKEYDGQSIIKDYDETCEYVDYPDDSCFIIGKTNNFKITDVNTCKTSFINNMGVDNETATSICNDEPTGVFGGLSLTEYLLYYIESDTSEEEIAESMSSLGISRVSNENFERMITNYTCTDEKIIIPEEINGMEIVAIGINAFRDKKLVKVRIPESVTSIGRFAFSFNQLTSVKIPESVTEIQGYAFYENQLTSVEIPNSVTSIGDYAFAHNQLTSVEIPNSVTRIEYSAFRINQLTSVTIPNSVTSIGEGAFDYNQLMSIEIPSSVTSIEDFAFSRNQLTSVEIPSSVTSIGEGAFKENQLTSVEIPSSVTNIGERTFAYNQLTSVEIPSSVTSIGDNAFSYNQLTSVTIPNSVTSIGWRAFFDNQLISVEIPNSVTSIENSAFNNNRLPDDQAFIYARNSDGSIDNTTLVSYGGAKRDNVIIPSSVTSIGVMAFSYNQLTSVTIPTSVTSIGNYAFDDNQLTSVIIEGKSNTSDFTSYGNGVFGWAEGYSDSNITFVNE